MPFLINVSFAIFFLALLPITDVIKSGGIPIPGRLGIQFSL